MANPKRRTSKARQGKRRSHHAINAQAVNTCANCGALRRPHYICDSCGHYNGKQAVAVSED